MAANTKDMKAENILPKNEGAFRNLMEQSPFSIQIHTPDGRLAQANEAYSKLFKLNTDLLAEIYEKYNILQDPQAEKLGLMPYIKKAFAGEIVDLPEYEYNVIDTLKTLDFNNIVFRKFWLKTRAFPIIDNNDALTHVVFMSEEITARKKAEKALEKSHIFNDTLIQSSNMMIIGLHKDRKINLFNPAAERLTGYTLKELQNKDWFDTLVPRVKYPRVHEEFYRTMKDGIPESFENPILTKSGEERIISWSNSEIREGDDIIGILSFGTDITDRIKAEEERNRLFNLSSDLIGIADFEGFFKQINPAWENSLGYSIDELMAKPFLDFIHPDDQQNTVAEMGKLSEGYKTFDFENRYIHKNGSIKSFSWTATSLPEKGMIYCIARDITDRKRAEKKILAYQQRLKDLATELTLSEEKQRRQIATDLHDHVGQLLASSRIQLSLFNDSMDKKEILDKTKNISQSILQAIQATRHVIFDLSPPQLKEIGLVAALADWSEEEIENKYGINIKLTGDERILPMNDNLPVLLFRIIRELLINIVKHAEATHVNLDIRKINDTLKISVKDNGIGFNYDPEILRLKHTGFGLFSILEKMEDLGGSVQIDSSPGKGTVIDLMLPLTDKK